MAFVASTSRSTGNVSRCCSLTTFKSSHKGGCRLRCQAVQRPFTRSGLQVRVQATQGEVEELQATKERVANGVDKKLSDLSSPSAGSSASNGLRELTVVDFDTFLEENKDRLTVVDFFTDFCGPCKVILPILVQWAQEMPEVSFVKLNCNKANKELGKRLKIRVAPTFQLYRDSKLLAEMTGAKVEELRALIEKHK